MRFKKNINLYFVLVVLFIVSIAPFSIAQGQTAVFLTANTTLYLPLIRTAPPEPEPDPSANPIHDGIATYYGATGEGACSFDATPNDLMVAAMNADEYDNSAVCGAYVHVTGAKGSVVVRIVDLCPGCSAGHLDLSPQAFGQIDDLIKGIVPIQWQIVSPPIEGSIAYKFKEGSNQWWTAVQVRNHRNPIAKFEYQNEQGDWINVPRTSYNYFVQTNPGMGPGPYTFRVTDSYGNVLSDSGIPHVEGGVISGTGQFPTAP